MTELIKALHVIQEECFLHYINDYDTEWNCLECPMSTDGGQCLIANTTPDNWKINDVMQKALL